MSGVYDRTKILLSEAQFDKLRNASVLVVGVGGVGGYAVEMLVRAGIGKLTLVDGDTIDVTNINRQIIATIDNVGKSKVGEFAKRIASINRDVKVEPMEKRFNALTADEILGKNYDYVIDAIDSVKDKIDLITASKQRGLKIVSAMGAGNRLDVSDFAITDIFKTSYDGLSRKIRKLLKDRGITSHTVAASNTAGVKNESGMVGSISYMPALAGVKLGAYVINELIKA